MTHPRLRRFPLPVRAAARGAVIAGFLAVVAVAGALSAVAATRTVETSAILELQFWVAPDAPAAFVSTRQQGADWSTHDYLVLLRESPPDERLLVSDPVSLSVPVAVEVEEAPQPVFVAAAAPTPQPTPSRLARRRPDAPPAAACGACGTSARRSARSPPRCAR